METPPNLYNRNIAQIMEQEFIDSHNHNTPHNDKNTPDPLFKDYNRQKKGHLIELENKEKVKMMMNSMKKQLKFIEDTNWMFEKENEQIQFYNPI